MNKELEVRFHNLVAFLLETIEAEGKRFNFHSRIPDLYIPRDMVNAGKSTNLNKDSKKHVEHVVPIIYLINLSSNLYFDGIKDIDIHVKIWKKCYKTIVLTKEEAKLIDKDHKTKMPSNWDYKNDSEFERLKFLQIKYN